MPLLEETIPWTDDQVDTIVMVDESVMPTMIPGEDVLYHRLHDAMNEEITATETERDTGLHVTTVPRGAVVVATVEAGGGVAGHHITVVRPAARSFSKDCR